MEKKIYGSHLLSPSIKLTLKSYQSHTTHKSDIFFYLWAFCEDFQSVIPLPHSVEILLIALHIYHHQHYQFEVQQTSPNGRIFRDNPSCFCKWRISLFFSSCVHVGHGQSLSVVSIHSILFFARPCRTMKSFANPFHSIAHNQFLFGTHTNMCTVTFLLSPKIRENYFPFLESISLTSPVSSVIVFGFAQ